MESKIKSLEDAFIAQGIDPNVRPDVSMLPEIDKAPTVENFERDVLIRALNSEGLDEVWVPDYDNDDQLKWEHVYYKTSAGWSLFSVVVWTSTTRCGSRRVFRTQEIGKYAWQQFPQYFKNML